MLEITSINVRTWSRLGQRGVVFGLVLPDIASQRDDVWVLTADLGLLSGLDRFKTAYPDRYINVGIAEQNMIGVASGLAKEGACTFVTTYATFITMRSFEQIRHNLGYMQYNVKIVGSASGLSMGMSGNTHYSIEDIALMRTIPNMTVVSPADSFESVKIAYQIADMHEPVYLRLTGGLNCPIVYKEDYDLIIGKGVVLQDGRDIAIVAVGTMVAQVLQSAKMLKEKGINPTIINMHTIKPLDEVLLKRIGASHKLLVTVEEHSIIGGLGSSVAELFAEHPGMARLLRIGLPDYFDKAASYQYLLNHFGLTAEKISKKIEMAINNRICEGILPNDTMDKTAARAFGNGNELADAP